VSRSSALASKATGFPIAKIAAKLAIGYTLDEIPNDITRETPACFEPTIDYVVVKIPRFTFDKFPQTKDTLGPQMKSVGEAMAIGRTFKEALQKALRSLEIGNYGLEEKIRRSEDDSDESSSQSLEFKQREIETVRERLRQPNAERLWYVADALRMGMSIEELYHITKIDQWFLENIAQILQVERGLLVLNIKQLTRDALREAKQLGFADVRLARLLGCSEAEVRERREQWNILPVYKTVDTCAAEFVAHTPYLYSTYENEDEAQPSARKKFMILGGGPNRIGQGIEFDYCCVHAAFALKDDGFETIMVNCNPETVSTDYDTSDKLFFEPLTLEDVLSIVREEQPFGVIVQFGGQTPLKLAMSLEQAGVPILGTSPDSIDRAEDRERFKEVLDKLGLRQPPNGTSRSLEEAIRIATSIGYPVLVRPSYVLGGRAMQIDYDEERLRRYMREAVSASPEHPVLIDKFLDDAIEVDVDAVSDGHMVVIGGIMEHIELAGVHSGDSACSLPPRSLSADIQTEIRRQTVALANELRVIGLMNVQFAVKDDIVYVLEVNPRASRTVPFVSKAIGAPLAKIAARVMAGMTLQEIGFTEEIIPPHVSVKEAVFPFIKFPGVDTVLGPEMKSTGEVMGIAVSFPLAFAKSQIAAGTLLPVQGMALLSVRDADKMATLPIARRLVESGFSLMATHGTALFLRNAGICVGDVKKVAEGSPHVVDAIREGKVSLVINTIDGAQSFEDSFSIRRSALECRVPYSTTIAGAGAIAEGIAQLRCGLLNVQPLQEYHQSLLSS
jgi:carbamoyl-phosphate synthase large subunit